MSKDNVFLSAVETHYQCPCTIEQGCDGQPLFSCQRLQCCRCSSRKRKYLLHRRVSSARSLRRDLAYQRQRTREALQGFSPEHFCPGKILLLEPGDMISIGGWRLKMMLLTAAQCLIEGCEISEPQR